MKPGLWILGKLPAGLRTKIIEGRIGAWLRGHGATEEQVMSIMSGYKTKAAALAAIGGGLYGVWQGWQAHDWQAAQGSWTVASAGLIALGLRLDGALAVKLGAAAAVLGGIGLGADGVAHGWDLGKILAGVKAIGVGLAGLGIHLSPPMQEARALRRARALEPRPAAPRAAEENGW